MPLIFHPHATIAYEAIQRHETQLLALFPRDPAGKAAEFARRWNTELAACPPQTRQFLAAYACAATHGDVHHYNRDKGQRRAIWKSFRPELLHGEPATVFAEHGLFALLLPSARELTGNLALSRTELLNANLQFALAAALTATLLDRYANDLLKTAIALHSGFLTPASNDLHVGYRGKFPHDFIKHFNSVNPQEQHEQQTSSTGPAGTNTTSGPAGTNTTSGPAGDETLADHRSV